MDDINSARDEQELSKLGSDWPNRLKRYDERTRALAGLLLLIEKKVPSDAALEAQSRAKRLKEEGIIH